MPKHSLSFPAGPIKRRSHLEPHSPGLLPLVGLSCSRHLPFLLFPWPFFFVSPFLLSAFAFSSLSLAFLLRFALLALGICLFFLFLLFLSFSFAFLFSFRLSYSRHLPARAAFFRICRATPKHSSRRAKGAIPLGTAGCFSPFLFSYPATYLYSPAFFSGCLSLLSRVLSFGISCSCFVLCSVLCSVLCFVLSKCRARFCAVAAAVSPKVRAASRSWSAALSTAA